MPEQPKGLYHLLRCPLCEGRGELPQKDLLDRLDEKDLGHKLASYVENFIPITCFCDWGNRFFR
jgi:hypothetical protein